MNKYKEVRISLGGSDIALITCVGIIENKEDSSKSDIGTHFLKFGQDGEYGAYVIDQTIEVPAHYQKVAEFINWMATYDDNGHCNKFHAERIELYRAGEMGAIVRLINPLADALGNVNRHATA